MAGRKKSKARNNASTKRLKDAQEAQSDVTEGEGSGIAFGPAELHQRNDLRHTMPFALPVECLELTPKHIDFCEHYLLTSNATDSYTHAFGDARSASTLGSRLLRKAGIQAYLRARMNQLLQDRAISVEFVASELLDTYRKAKEPVPIYNANGDYTGEYAFDGRTAVACLIALSKLKGYVDKDKDDGRTQRPFNIAIVLGKYRPEAAAKLIEHTGIEAPRPDAEAKVPGFPKVQLKPVKRKD